MLQLDLEYYWKRLWIHFLDIGDCSKKWLQEKINTHRILKIKLASEEHYFYDKWKICMKIYFLFFSLVLHIHVLRLYLKYLLSTLVNISLLTLYLYTLEFTIQQMRYEKYKIPCIYLINEITQRAFSIVSKIQFLVSNKKKNFTRTGSKSINARSSYTDPMFPYRLPRRYNRR